MAAVRVLALFVQLAQEPIEVDQRDGRTCPAVFVSMVLVAVCLFAIISSCSRIGALTFMDLRVVVRPSFRQPRDLEIDLDTQVANLPKDGGALYAGVIHGPEFYLGDSFAYGGSASGRSRGWRSRNLFGIGGTRSAADLLTRDRDQGNDEREQQTFIGSWTSHDR